MTRERHQATPSGYRSQMRDPVTGRKLSLRASSLAELESRQRRVRDTRDGLRYGDISVRQAQGALRPAVGMSVQVAALWARYVRGLPKGSERVARSVWKYQLAPWFETASVWDLSEAKMRAWRTDLERVRRSDGAKSAPKKHGYSPKTRRLAYDLLRAALSLAIRDGALSEFPWGGFSVPNPHGPERERETLRDPAELVRLLTAARAWDADHGLDGASGRFPVLVVLLLTGLRQAEAAGLSWADLELDAEPYRMHIRHQARRGWPADDGGDRPSRAPKGKHTRAQILHPNVAAALTYQRKALRALGRYRPDGPVFPRPGARADWRTSGIVMTPRAFRDLVARAGLPNPADWTVHSARHSFARLELVGHGGDLRTVAERTGHRDLSILEGYLRKAARRDGQGGSMIPELPVSLGPPALEARGQEAAAPAALNTRPALTTGTPLDALTVVAALEEDDEDRAESRWARVARAWIDAGRPGRKRPKAISKEIKGIYSRAYARELFRSRGAEPEKAREAGKRARRAALGAWARVLERLEIQTRQPAT